MIQHRIGPIGIDPVLETMFSLIVILACFLIFYKLKEIAELSEHKGIIYFRYVFLFFGLTHLFRIVTKWIIPNIHPRFMDLSAFQIFMINLGMSFMFYASTAMFIYLVLIFVRKEGKNLFFENPWVIHLTAAVVAILSLFQSMPFLFLIFQLGAFIIAILLLTIHKKKLFKNKQNPWAISTYIMIFGHFIIIQFLELFSLIFHQIATILYILALCFFVILVDRIYLHFSKYDIKFTREKIGKKRKA